MTRLAHGLDAVLGDKSSQIESGAMVMYGSGGGDGMRSRRQPAMSGTTMSSAADQLAAQNAKGMGVQWGKRYPRRLDHELVPARSSF